MANTPKEQLGVDLPEPEPVEPQEITVEEPPEPVRPEGLPDKFKSMEDYNKSYLSLEEELRERGREQNEMRSQLDQMTSVLESLTAQQQQPQPQVNDAYQAQLYAAYENDPLGTTIFLQQQAAQQAVQQALAQYQQQFQPAFQQQQMMQGELMATSAERVLEARYPDWNEYGAKVGEVLERNPMLLTPDVLGSMDKTTEVLEMIYKQVKYDDVASQLEAATNNTSQMKMQAQTVSGGAGRPVEPSEQDEKINRLIAAAKNSSYAAFRSG